MKKNVTENKIDFVILWVDGNDEKWLNEKNKYLNVKGDNGENRFRDCDNLEFLFRGIEKYAPWVNNIFFVTWGHIPKWLNTNHPKLKIVKHEEFIPHEYLPTFNSNVIELNLHRIKELSENFVLFNDDLFLLKPTKSTDFFKDNLPRDVFVEYTQLASSYNDNHFFMKANILAIINKYFNKKNFVKKNFSKVINYNYGNLNGKTIKTIFTTRKFCGFWNFHAPQAYLKSTFSKLWDLETEALDTCSRNKFRTSTDLGHYLCRYWQMLEGNFIPKKNESKYFVYSNDNKNIVKAIKNQEYKMICINDAFSNIDFEKATKEVNEAFKEVFKEKSKFEI